MVHSAVLLGLLTLFAGQSVAAELYHDFRDGRPVEPLRRFGPEANSSIEPEKAGLRIKLPANRAQKDPVGVVLDHPLKGDFEITAGYEIVHLDRPTDGWGVGFELYVMTATPTQEAIGCYRM